MNISVNVVLAVVIIFGFLTGSSLYFYNKSRPNEAAKTSNTQTFSGDIPTTGGSVQPDAVDKLTKPADSRGRVTFPANVYTVKKGETLFAIGAKFAIDWQLIVLANGLENENVVQSGKQLVIPKLSNETDYYRIIFTADADNASELNRQLRDQAESEHYNPILVAKRDAIPYFGISESDDFSLVEQDNSRGTALVKAIAADRINVIGLYQPKQKGEKGFWSILYIENHDWAAGLSGFWPARIR